MYYQENQLSISEFGDLNRIPMARAGQSTLFSPDFVGKYYNLKNFNTDSTYFLVKL